MFLFEDALMGIRDLFRKHPAELRLHKYAAIEKLRERIGDDDKVVRETLYQLFKSVIFPGCKEVILFFFLISIVVFIVVHHTSSPFFDICFSVFLVQDNQELLVSLIMAYIFNAMTHLAIDVRLMAFKFLDLVVENYPPSFFLYAEKVS